MKLIYLDFTELSLSIHIHLHAIQGSTKVLGICTQNMCKFGFFRSQKSAIYLTRRNFSNSFRQLSSRRLISIHWTTQSGDFSSKDWARGAIGVSTSWRMPSNAPGRPSATKSSRRSLAIFRRGAKRVSKPRGIILSICWTKLIWIGPNKVLEQSSFCLVKWNSNLCNRQKWNFPII